MPLSIIEAEIAIKVQTPSTTEDLAYNVSICTTINLSSAAAVEDTLIVSVLHIKIQDFKA